MSRRSETLSVVLVCDVRLYRDGLAHVLEADGRLCIVGVASSTTEALAEVDSRRPVAVILDVEIPGARRTISAIMERAPDTQVIALGLEESEGDVVAYAEAGIAGYLCREGSVEDLVGAVRKAAQGHFPCSQRVAGALLRRVRVGATQRAAGPSDSGLTPRELQIARLLDVGLTNKEIAARLFIAVATVKNHVHHILEKLDARTRGEAAAKLRERHQLNRPLGVPAAVLHKGIT